MTSFRLVALRVYGVTLGRFAFFSKALRAFLLKRLVRSAKGGRKYTASSRFFETRELD